MIRCPCCGSKDIDISDEGFFATIRGYAEASAACECTNCWCTFDLHAEGSFVTCEDDYEYTITHEPDEEEED